MKERGGKTGYIILRLGSLQLKDILGCSQHCDKENCQPRRDIWTLELVDTPRCLSATLIDEVCQSTGRMLGHTNNILKPC